MGNPVYLFSYGNGYDNSREDSTMDSVWFAEIPFVTQKSIKSGNLFKSDGQYVGLSDEIWQTLHCFEQDSAFW